MSEQPEAPRRALGGASVWRPDAAASGTPNHAVPPPAGPEPGWATPVPPSPGWVNPTPPPPAVYPAYQLDPAMVTGLPVEPSTHPFFYRTPRWRWWKPLLAFIAATVLAFIAMIVPALIGMLVDRVDFAAIAKTGKMTLGPWAFLGNNIGLALLIPIAMLLQWLLFGQRPGWLSSVLGRFRWGWFARCVAVAVPIWLVMMGIEIALTGLPKDISVRPYTVLLIIGILLTTPFQAAGEEYLMRGLEQRLVASYFKRQTLGWIVATIVSSVTFMLLHGAGDIWLNIMYFCFGAIASWITWKTGGLEAAVAIHVVNNLVSEALMPWTDFSHMFDREAGAADASILIQVVVLVVAAGLMWFMGRRTKVATASAPGQVDLQAAHASMQAWTSQSWGYLPQPPSQYQG